jgi:hypothetical protein
MSADEAPASAFDARQRRLAVRLAQHGIDPRTATFGTVAEALAAPGNRERLGAARSGGERRVPFPPALAAALAPYRGAEAGPVFAPRDSVPTYEEFSGKWVRHLAGQSRALQQGRERDGGLADDDAVAEQP